MPLRIHKQDDPRKDWQKFNALAAQVERMAGDVALARETLTNLRGTLGNLIAGMHPFKIYRVPPHLRASTSADDWRKVRVRAGRALGQNISSGTDAATEPDEGGYPSVTDITVPAATSAYYIILTVSTAAVTHSATPPTESADVIVLGVCDSNTRAATQELVIRQYVRTDIISTGGGGAQRYKIQSVSTNYVVAKTWDGTNLGATAVNIALPPRLRGSAPVSGAAIRPAYAANDEFTPPPPRAAPAWPT